MTQIIPTKTPPIPNKIEDEHWYEFWHVWENIF